MFTFTLVTESVIEVLVIFGVGQMLRTIALHVLQHVFNMALFALILAFFSTVIDKVLLTQLLAELVCICD